MSAVRHTPGPWIASAYKAGTFDMATGKTSEMRHAGYDIRAAEPKMFGGTPILKADISDANARLIAAAPELLVALKQAEQQIDYGQIDAAHRIIIAAIAKAEGRS